MGYGVTVELTDVRIPADNVADCLAAINAMHDLKAPWNSKYSWVTDPSGNGFKSLKAAFEAWRYDAFVDEEDGSVTIDCFEGEKWGDDEQLFQTIAPFVEDEGLIECRGEDGAQWRYAFNDGSLDEQTAKIVWE